MPVPRKEASSGIRLKDHQIYSPGERGRDMTGNGSGLGGLLSWKGNGKLWTFDAFRWSSRLVIG